MSGFGGAPVFGAQALSNATGQARTSSPFQAPTTSAFPPQATTSSGPFSQQPQSQTSPSFGVSSSNTTNALGSTPPNSGGSLAGFNTTNKDAAMNNPFAAATAASAGSPAPNPFAPPNPFTSAASNSPFAFLSNNSNAGPASSFGQPIQQPSNTFSPFGQPTQQSNSAASPFAQPAQQSSNANSPFGQPFPSSNNAASPFSVPANGVQKRKNVFEDKTDSKRPGTTFATSAFPKPQTNFAAPALGNKSNTFGANGISKNTTSGSDRQTKSSQVVAAFGRKKSPSVYVQEIHDQLRKDNLRPPAWPRDPGNPDNLKAVDDHRVKYRAYEGKVRASLIKAGLIDDPEVRKKLSDAIDFRGICEDMCPEGEKVSRIVEHDVKQPERFRNTNSANEGWANPDLMIKSFKRSAAGVDSPLPTEVRSPAALRRTVDYLIDDLLQGDESLPFMHGFLWDRTRAIRKDFIFQNAMTPEERIDQIYCLENITRFHATSLHLLSKDGKAADFSEQQEREQLGKTLLSLIQVYDECKDMDITIENEAEFRAYFLLFNAHDPFVIQQMQDWNDRFWFESPEIQTAVSLIHVMQNNWNYRGPMRPLAPLTTGSQSFSNYFAIVADPEVSYTMACVAEIHFTEIRRLMLKALHKSYARVRDGPKDLTARVLNDMFCFDTEEQCLEYLKDYDMEFSTEGATEPYMVVVRRRGIPHKTVKQSGSQKMVERKRGRHTLPDVVHNTVFEEASPAVDTLESPDGLFVTQPDTSMVVEQKNGAMDVGFIDESPSTTPAPTNQSIAIPPPAFSSGFSFSQDETTTTVNAPARNPFLPQTPSAPTSVSLSTDKSANTAQPATFPWTSTSSSGVFQSTMTPEQRVAAAPIYSWSSTSVTAPPAAGQDSGGVFDLLNKPPERPQAPLFPTTVPGLVTATNIFSTTPTGGQDKSNEATDVSATSFPKESSTPKESPRAPLSIFAAPAPSASNSTPLSFGPTLSAPTPSSNPFGVNITSKSTGMPTFSPEPTVGVKTSVVTAAKSPAPAKDMMGDFAKWVLLGDYGMMGQLEEKILEDLLRETYDRYREEEHERKQRQEDEHALAEALAYRTYSLQVKFLHLWRHNARRKFARNAAKKNKMKMREWRDEQIAKGKADKIRREKEERARQKRLTGPKSWLEELDKDRSAKRLRRESMSLDTSRRTSPASDADVLLATGIFDGIPNKQEFATNAIRDDDSLYDALVGVNIGANPTRQVMGPPAKPTKDPLRSARDAGISKPQPKQKYSKKAQALRDLMSGQKKDDDLLSFRSSTSSQLGQSVRSLPGGKVTNFSKYQSSSPRSSADPDRPKKGSSSGIKSSYWLLRSRGLYATSAGHVLSERAPPPRSGSNCDSASQYSGDSDNGDYDDRVLEQDGAYRASLGLTGGQSMPTSRRSTFSLGAGGSPTRSGLLKSKQSSLRQSLPTGGMAASLLESRSQRGEADAGSQAGSNVSTMQQDVEETLRELRKVAAEMDQDTEWYREQNGRMSQGHCSG